MDQFETQQLVAAGLTLLQRCAPLVRALSGKRGAILLPTSPAFFTALAACDGRGAVLVNPWAAPAEIAHQLADARAGAVFTIGAFAGHVPRHIPRVLLDDAPRVARFAGEGTSRDVDLASHAGLAITGEPDAPGRDDEAAIVYTSAMAGTPLGAILTHRNLLENAGSTVAAAGNGADDQVLAVLPFAHLFGLVVTGAAPLLAGARVVTMPRFVPARAVELIAGGKITEVAGVPAVFRSLLGAMERHGERGAGELRLCICGGSPLSADLQEQWFDATGVELRQGYGLTEAGPVCLFNRVDMANAPGTLGEPLPGVRVELRTPVPYDESGQARVDLAAADVSADAGEICVRGDNVFAGYVSGSPAGLAVRDGWLHTGDLGRRDSSGRITFAGVAKPMFTRNGFNVYPREIERAVSSMPGIDGVTVRELAEPDRESEIGLDVRGAVSEDAVRRWCAERLSAYKQPSVVSIR